MNHSKYKKVKKNVNIMIIYKIKHIIIIINHFYFIKSKLHYKEVLILRELSSKECKKQYSLNSSSTDKIWNTLSNLRAYVPGVSLNKKNYKLYNMPII